MVQNNLLMLAVATASKDPAEGRKSSASGRRAPLLPYIYIYIYICACIYIYIYICMYIYIYICIYIHMYIYIYIMFYLFIYYIYIYTHIHTYLSLYIYMYTYISLYKEFMYIYIYIDIHIYIYIYILKGGLYRRSRNAPSYGWSTRAAGVCEKRHSFYDGLPCDPAAKETRIFPHFPLICALTADPPACILLWDVFPQTPVWTTSLMASRCPWTHFRPRSDRSPLLLFRAWQGF